MVIQEFKNDRYADIKEYVKNLTIYSFNDNKECIYEINDENIEKIIITKNEHNDLFLLEIITPEHKNDLLEFNIFLHPVQNEIFRYLMKL